MALRNEEIAQAVSVEIDKVCPPSGIEQRYLAHSGGVGGVGKTQIPIIVIERIRFIRECGAEDIEIPVVIIIPRSGSHSCVGLSIFVIARAARNGDIFKRSIAFVVIER